MTQTFRQKYFGSWSFYKSAIAIALPVMAQMLIQSLVSLVDNFMVSGMASHGSNALWCDHGCDRNDDDCAYSTCIWKLE